MILLWISNKMSCGRILVNKCKLKFSTNLQHKLSNIRKTIHQNLLSEIVPNVNWILAEISSWTLGEWQRTAAKKSAKVRPALDHKSA